MLNAWMDDLFPLYNCICYASVYVLFQFIFIIMFMGLDCPDLIVVKSRSLSSRGVGMWHKRWEIDGGIVKCWCGRSTIYKVIYSWDNKLNGWVCITRTGLQMDEGKYTLQSELYGRFKCGPVIMEEGNYKEMVSGNMITLRQKQLNLKVLKVIT